MLPIVSSLQELRALATPNPWTTLSSREVYKNPWIRVRHEEVLCPNGEPGIYGLVDANTATGVVAVDGDHIVLVGQYRYPLNAYSWEIVEGGAEPGEPPLQAAKRELLEEAGVVAESWRELGGEIHLSNCFSSERGYLFLAEGLSFGASRPDETESLIVRRVPISLIRNMLEQNAFQDALTVIALYRFLSLSE